MELVNFVVAGVILMEMNDLETVEYLNKKYKEGWMLVILLDKGKVAVTEHNPKQNGLIPILMLFIQKLLGGPKMGGSLN